MGKGPIGLVKSLILLRVEGVYRGQRGFIEGSGY
jgi:hypothetical protein